MIQKHREQRSTNKDKESKKTHHKLEKVNALERSNFDKNEVNYTKTIPVIHFPQ